MEISDKLTRVFSLKKRRKGGEVEEEAKDKLDQRLANFCRQFFNKKVEFHTVSSFDSHLEHLKAKYKPLNISMATVGTSSSPTNDEDENSEKVSPHGADDIPKPRKELFDSDDLQMDWKHPRGIGAGLCNLGNTCFLNSVLQCLVYTPPLHNYVTSLKHKQKCQNPGFCVLCELQKHSTKVLSSPNSIVKPLPIVQNLRAIAKQFRQGRQEDAHEFLRYFVDGLQKSCLQGLSPKLDLHSKATTVVHKIFGGYHRSQVKCLECMKTSNTFDPLLDISLDIKNCSTLARALQKSTQVDTLEENNRYACPFCKKMTRAEKKFTLHRLPNILTIQLKRFEYNGMFGGKINKPISFSEHVNMRPYMSETKGPSQWYSLYAVLVHFGYSSNSGHYYCYVRNSNKTWYCMNDTNVSQVGLSTVLSQEAYLLFYIKDIKYKPQEVNPPSRTPGGNLNHKTSGGQQCISASSSIGGHAPPRTPLSGNNSKRGNNNNGSKVKEDPKLPPVASKSEECIEKSSPNPNTPPKPTGIVNPSPHSSTKSSSCSSPLVPKAPPSLSQPTHVITPTSTTPITTATSIPAKLENEKMSPGEKSVEGVREFSIPLRKSCIPTLNKRIEATKTPPVLSSATPTPSQVKKKKVPLTVPIFTPRQIATPLKHKKIIKIKRLAMREGNVRGEGAPAMPSPAKCQASLVSSSQNISEVTSISGNTPMQEAPVLPLVTGKSLLEDGKKEQKGEEKAGGKKERIDKKLERRKEEKMEKLEGTKEERIDKLEGRKEEEMEKLEERKDGGTEKMEGRKEEKLEGKKEERREKLEGKREEGTEKMEGRKDERMEKFKGRKEERRAEDKEVGRMEEKEEERKAQVPVKPKPSRSIQQGFVALAEQTTSADVLSSKSVATFVDREAYLRPALSSNSPTTNPHLDSMRLTPFSFKQKVAMVSPLPHSIIASSKPIARVKPNLHLSPVDSGSKSSDIHLAHSGTQVKGTPTPSPQMNSHLGLSLPWAVSNKSHDVPDEKTGERGRRMSSSEGNARGWKVTNHMPISERNRILSSSRSAKKKRKKKRKHKHHSYLPSSESSDSSEVESPSESKRHRRDQEEWKSGRTRNRRDYSSDDEDNDRHRRHRDLEIKCRHSKKHKKIHKKHREESKRWREKDRKKHRHSTTSYARSSSSDSSGRERDGRGYRSLWKHSEKKREHFRYHKHRSPSPWSGEDRRRKRERWRGGDGERSRSPADQKKIRLDSSSRVVGKDGTKKLKAVPEVEWDGGGMRESDGGAARRAGGSETMKHLTSNSWGKLGEQVLSWTGGENSIDRSSDAEGGRGDRKTVRDHWDQELDKGKVKKSKKHCTAFSKSDKNVFQNVQTKRNKSM